VGYVKQFLIKHILCVFRPTISVPDRTSKVRSVAMLVVVNLQAIVNI
jgi:hypothetical protein